MYVCVGAYRDIVWASKVSNHTGTGAYPHVTDKRENPSENVCVCWIKIINSTVGLLNFFLRRHICGWLLLKVDMCILTKGEAEASTQYSRGIFDERTRQLVQNPSSSCASLLGMTSCGDRLAKLRLAAFF